MNAARWRARLNRANAVHVTQMTHALRREFARLLRELDPKNPTKALRTHGARLNALIGAHKRQTAATFGFLALEMMRPLTRASEAKAEKVQENAPLTRAEQVSSVLVELARTVAAGALVALIAEALARDRQLVAAVEGAILSAADPMPRAIAATLLESPRVARRLALARSIATGAEAVVESVTNAASGDSGAIGNVRNDQSGGGGGGQTPPNNPIGGDGGDPPPRRSRFSLLVERLVREEAPRRARSIAMGSGQIIADVLAQGAREGWNEQRARKELEARLGPEVADFRARRIARTELGAAQNEATLAIARDRAAAGAALEKVWVAIDDGRTRQTHADADDQVRPLEEPFAVGRASLMHPGDPRAPLGEIVNCRCAMLIRAVG